MATTRLKCRFSFFAFFLFSDLEHSVSLGCIWKSRVWFRIGTQFLVGIDQRLWSRTEAAYADLVQSFWAHHAREFTKGSCSVWHWISHRLRSPYFTVANSSWISTRCSRKLFQHISFLNRLVDWNLVSCPRREFFTLDCVCRHRVATNRLPICHKNISIRKYWMPKMCSNNIPKCWRRRIWN